MKRKALHIFVISAIACSLWFSHAPSIFAQSQALNAQIEGTVLDQNNAAIPNAAITVTNIETGAVRTAAVNESGVYRFPLLPLGAYRMVVEAANFKKFIREGIILTTGQSAVIDVSLGTGDVSEAVTVSRDTSIADAGKTDLGRVMNTREVQNLPQVQLNPYNFGILQANVTGRPSRGFAFPRINVNGYLRRVNYLLDGNTNTSYEARTRFTLISGAYVSEIQLVTNGFAPEFGDTPGMIMNVVTPSGTNAFHGSATYRFRRPSFYTRPFFYDSPEDIPDNNADNFTGTVGGPIANDRWHYYFGYEWQYRDDRSGAARRITINPENRAALISAGLSPSIFPPAMPSLEKGSFYIFRTDVQLNDRNRFAMRYNHAHLNAPNFPQGRLNTLERGSDSFSIDHDIAAQLTSYTPSVFNEFRFQYGQRSSGFRRNELSGTGPSIVIAGVANFGSPANIDTAFPPLKITQFQDNLMRTTGAHVFKFGGGVSVHHYTERAAIYSEYRFSSIANYTAARNGSNPKSYSRYTEQFGDPETTIKAAYWNVFAQDDWKLTRRLKMNYGLRYDLYKIPDADPTSPFPLSRKFDVDKNDLAPRLGIVYALREGSRPTVLRAGAGIYYEAPLLAIYRDVLQHNGGPGFSSVELRPSAANAPAFPNTLGPGALLPPQDIYTIAEDYDTMYAVHSNIQVEQALTEDLSVAVGYVFSAGRHLNVYRNINAINPVRYLSDGRPVFGDDKLDPRFGWIVIAESAGVARYGAMAVQLTQRLSGGLQFSINYTLAKARNDAPDGDFEGIFLSDPTNRAIDKGYSSADQRHTFAMSLVYSPHFTFVNKTVRNLFNNNQFGIISAANSGERFNIYADVIDLNGDSIDVDRPVSLGRNAGKTPSQFNTDLRYSRFFNFGGRYKLEVFGEFQNLFNNNSIVGFSDTTVPTDPKTGKLIGQLPTSYAGPIAQESRQFEIGVRVFF